MGVSATFTADFSSFNDAIAKSVIKIKGLDTDSRNVERSLNRLTDAFSGRKLIQEATQTATAIERMGEEGGIAAGLLKLTDDELRRVGDQAAIAVEKLKRLGVEVPPKLQTLATAAEKPKGAFDGLLSSLKSVTPMMAAFGATLSIGAVVGFAKEIGSFAGEMVDLSAQTGISTSRLQAFNLVAAGAGLTVQDVATAADQLSKRIGQGDQSVAGALAKMNLSLDDLRKKNIDEVLFEIDRGLQGVSNQFVAADIKADLFGKTGAALGRIFDGSLEKAVTGLEHTGAVIDEELLRKADEFDDYWSQAWIKFRAYAAGAIGAAAEGLGQLGGAMADVGRAQREDATMNYQPTPDMGPVYTPFSGTRRTPRPGFGLGSTAQDQIMGGGMKGILAREEADKKAAEAAKKFAEETEAGAIATRKWSEKMDRLEVEKAALEVFAFATETSKATESLRALTMRALAPPGNLTGALQAGSISTSLLMGGPGAVTSKGGAFGGLAAGGALPKDLLGSLGLKDAFKSLPQTIIGAIQGGGNVAGAVGSTFGSALAGSSGLTGKLFGTTSATGETLTKGLLGGLPKMFTGAISSLLPGLGAMIGPMIGKLGSIISDKFFGGEGKKTNRERDAAIEKITGISGDKGASQSKFKEMASAAGVSAAELDQLFSTKNAQAFERQLDSITKKIEKYGDEQHRINAEAEADAMRVEGAIEKYGFTLEELGPKLQKQKLDEQAKDLIEDWRVLVGAGVDVGVVNARMADSVNKYLQTAKKMGTEVPKAMKPILEDMVDQGLLTDEAGNKITDLEAAGITFSETMTEGFDRVIIKLQELIDKIPGIGRALADLPNPGDITVPGVRPSGTPPGGVNDPHAYDNERPQPPEGPAFAGGTRGRFLNFGSGTVATLHGRERVVTEAEGRAEAASMAGVISEIQGLRSDFGWIRSTMPIALRDAVLLSR